jgi:hypothetical protein
MRYSSRQYPGTFIDTEPLLAYFSLPSSSSSSSSSLPPSYILSLSLFSTCHHLLLLFISSLSKETY